MNQALKELLTKALRSPLHISETNDVESWIESNKSEIENCEESLKTDFEKESEIEREAMDELVQFLVSMLPEEKRSYYLDDDYKNLHEQLKVFFDSAFLRQKLDEKRKKRQDQE